MDCGYYSSSGVLVYLHSRSRSIIHQDDTFFRLWKLRFLSCKGTQCWVSVENERSLIGRQRSANPLHSIQDEDAIRIVWLRRNSFHDIFEERFVDNDPRRATRYAVSFGNVSRKRDLRSRKTHYAEFAFEAHSFAEKLREIRKRAFAHCRRFPDFKSSEFLWK